MSVTDSAAPITAADIRAAMRRTYPENEYALAWEVAAATGFNARRHLDCVCMCLWPSRGLTLHGMEIKVSRSDWRRELREPAKAEELARYLDLFSIVAPAGVVPVDELPAAWGLIELRADKLVTTKRATRTEAAPIDRPFLAAMLRAAARPMDRDSLDRLLSQAREKAAEAAQDDVKRAVERTRREAGYELEQWRRIKEKLQAVHPDLDYFDDDQFARAVAGVLRSGVGRTYDGLAALSKHLTSMNVGIEAAMAAFMPDAAAPTKAAQRAEP